MNESRNNVTQQSATDLFDLDNLPGMEALMQEKEAADLAEGTITTGKVVEKAGNGAYIDIGFKAEGLVPKEEFRDFSAIETGDTIDVYIEALEDTDSELPLLSVKKAHFERAWTNFEERFNEGDIVSGNVLKRVKGGLSVDVEGIVAFLPGSQVDVVPVRDMDELIGSEEEFKILKISSERRNVVISRRELIEEKRAKARSEMLQQLEPGQVCNGRVKNITDFGAFVDFGGVDGLLHITDMSWGRISHPSEMLNVGDELEVVILDIDYEKQRLSLGLKQKEQNPWEDAAQKYEPGSKVKGAVVNVLPYGAFVEVEKGIEGLVHVSELSWTKRITNAQSVLNRGDEVEAMVLDVRPEEKKLSLGIRQLEENPWEVLAHKYPAGSKITGKVRNMTPYGAFVEIEEDIDGMVHVSDMSWTKKINHPGEVLKKGEEVEVVVLEINPEQQRVSLGMKQLDDDPWNVIDQRLHVGDNVEGKVSKITSFGAFVELEQGIEGLIHISELSEEHVKRVKDVLSVGDDVKARVIKVDAQERRIGLSLREPGSSEEYTGGSGYQGVNITESGVPTAEALGQLSNVFGNSAVTSSKHTESQEEEVPAQEDVPAQEEEAAAQAEGSAKADESVAELSVDEQVADAEVAPSADAEEVAKDESKEQE